MQSLFCVQPSVSFFITCLFLFWLGPFLNDRIILVGFDFRPFCVLFNCGKT